MNYCPHRRGTTVSCIHLHRPPAGDIDHFRPLHLTATAWYKKDSCQSKFIQAFFILCLKLKKSNSRTNQSFNGELSCGHPITPEWNIPDCIFTETSRGWRRGTRTNKKHREDVISLKHPIVGEFTRPIMNVDVWSWKNIVRVKKFVLMA